MILPVQFQHYLWQHVPNHSRSLLLHFVHGPSKLHNHERHMLRVELHQCSGQTGFSFFKPRHFACFKCTGFPDSALATTRPHKFLNLSTNSQIGTQSEVRIWIVDPKTTFKMSFSSYFYFFVLFVALLSTSHSQIRESPFLLKDAVKHFDQVGLLSCNVLLKMISLNKIFNIKVIIL